MKRDASKKDRHVDEAEETLRAIADGISAKIGEEFFYTLVQKLAVAFGFHSGLVAELTNKTPRTVRTIALWVGNKFEENIEYPLAGTPCEKVLDGHIKYYPDRVAHTFPKDLMLGEIGVVSYLGVPLFDPSNNKVIGHLAVLDNEPMKRESRITNILRIFAERASAEINRERISAELRNKITELEKFHKLIVDRELKMVELKKELKSLKN